MQTEAVENYLKTIFEIQQEGGRVKTSQLAKRLAVTAGSVTDMIKRLSVMHFSLPNPSSSCFRIVSRENHYQSQQQNVDVVQLSS